MLKMFSIILDEIHVKTLDGTFFPQACGTLLSSAHHIINAFCSTPVPVLATSPWQVYSRVGGAASILLRMALVHSSIPIAHLKIPDYLGRISARLSEVLQKYRIRAVALTLSLVDTMLNWYFNNVHPKNEPRPPAALKPESQHPIRQSPALPAPQDRFPQQMHTPPQPVSAPPQMQQQYAQMQHQQHFSQAPMADPVDVMMHAAPPLPPPVWNHDQVVQTWSDASGFEITPTEISSFLSGADGHMMFGGPLGEMMHFQSTPSSGGGGGGGGPGPGGGGGEGYWG